MFGSFFFSQDNTNTNSKLKLSLLLPVNLKESIKFLGEGSNGEQIYGVCGKNKIMYVYGMDFADSRELEKNEMVYIKMQNMFFTNFDVRVSCMSLEGKVIENEVIKNEVIKSNTNVLLVLLLESIKYLTDKSNFSPFDVEKIPPEQIIN